MKGIITTNDFGVYEALKMAFPEYLVLVSPNSKIIEVFIVDNL